MKEKLKGILIGAVIGAMLVTTGHAVVDTVTKEVNYNNIKITLNGNEVNPVDADGNYVEPFIIEGTTYLPVRGVANALGLDVDWDGETNTVIMNTSGANADYSIFNGSYAGGGVTVPGEGYTIGEWYAELSDVTKDSMKLSFGQSESDYYVDMTLHRQPDGSYYGSGYSSWDGYSYITIWLESAERISLTVSGTADKKGTEWLYRK